MTERRNPRAAFIWLAAALLCIGFFLWHNGLGTPLSETEINHYLEQIQS